MLFQLVNAEHSLAPSVFASMNYSGFRVDLASMYGSPGIRKHDSPKWILVCVQPRASVFRFVASDLNAMIVSQSPRCVWIRRLVISSS